VIGTAARLCAVSLSLACAAPSYGDTLRISAVIRPKAMLRFQDAPATLTISEQDVRNGYVDARAPVSLHVKSSGRRELMLLVTVQNEHVRNVRLEGLGAPLQMDSEGGVALLAPAADRPLALQFRFYLAPGTPAGLYPWPVQLAASA
jgi:hypothetical protein